MSDDLLTRARMLAQAATPGPWITVLGSGEHLCTAIMAEREHPFDNIFVADCLPDWALEEGVAPDNHVPNMLFIEASRELVPALCDALEQARAEIAQLRAERDAAEYLLSEGAEHAAADMDGEAQRWKAEAARLREALQRFAKIDLTSPIGDEIAWDILNARAALEVKP